MFRNLRIVLFAWCMLSACGTGAAKAEEPQIRLAGREEVARDTSASSAATTSEPSVLNSEMTYQPEWPAPPDTGAMLLRLVIGTVVVLGLCAGSLWFGKPWLMRLQLTNTTGQSMQIEGTVALGNRAVLYLVKIGDTQLVAGTDATGLKSLIALPASFKDVLDEPQPEVEMLRPIEPPPLIASRQS